MDAIAARVRTARETNDADADDEVVWSWRPDAGAKSCGDEPRDDRGKKARFPGESTKEAVKTIARGMPDDLAKPVVTAASFFICWRAMGEAFTRHSLHPLSFQRVMHATPRAQSRCENASLRLCAV